MASKIDGAAEGPDVGTVLGNAVGLDDGREDGTIGGKEGITEGVKIEEGSMDVSVDGPIGAIVEGDEVGLEEHVE